MDLPPPVVVARELAPVLAGLQWAIGGSVLLWKLGLEVAPRDLDIMTSSDRFDDVAARITQQLGPGRPVAHPVYRSRQYRRFTSAISSVDLFAEVRIARSGSLVEWYFDPTSIHLDAGLPWMRASDWIDLYDLFGRPDRVAALHTYLYGKSSRPA